MMPIGSPNPIISASRSIFEDEGEVGAAGPVGCLITLVLYAVNA